MSTTAPGERFEARDVPRRGATVFAACLVATVIALVGAVSWLGVSLWGFHGNPASALNRWHTATSPQPHLQIDPAAELKALHAAKEQRLNGTGWVDQRHGIVHIPIGRAMAIEAARGAGKGR